MVSFDKNFQLGKISFTPVSGGKVSIAPQAGRESTKIIPTRYPQVTQPQFTDTEQKAIEQLLKELEGSPLEARLKEIQRTAKTLKATKAMIRQMLDEFAKIEAKNIKDELSRYDNQKKDLASMDNGYDEFLESSIAIVTALLALGLSSSVKAELQELLKELTLRTMCQAVDGDYVVDQGDIQPPPDDDGSTENFTTDEIGAALVELADPNISTEDFDEIVSDMFAAIEDSDMTPEDKQKMREELVSLLERSFGYNQAAKPVIMKAKAHYAPARN